MKEDVEKIARLLCGEKSIECGECDSNYVNCEFWEEASLLERHGWCRRNDVIREIVKKFDSVVSELDSWEQVVPAFLTLLTELRVEYCSEVSER